VIGIGILLGGMILTYNKNAGKPSPSATDASATEKPGISSVKEVEAGKGPRGGKLLAAQGLGIEITMMEEGVEPRFRLYLYDNGKLASPSSAKVELTLVRLGEAAQLLSFKPEADYLISDQTVREPHSFDVSVSAEWKGKTLHWEYSQVEMRTEIPDAMLKSMGIEILTAGAATIKPIVKLPGEIIFNEHTIVQVVPRVSGIVTAVYGHHGMHVKKGEVLAIIESQMLAELRSQYLVSRKRLGLARTTFEREKRLWEEKITAKQDYLAAQELLNEAEIAVDLAAVKLRSLGVNPDSSTLKENLARYEIQAPVSGLITAKAIAQGQTLKDDANIYTVADVSTVWAAITVYPKDLAVIKVGQKVTVKATAFDIRDEGAVFYITTLIGGQTRTATARVELDNKDSKWRPGMFVNAELVTEEISVPVSVSAEAIKTIGDWTLVFRRYGAYY
jgi:cobalt-zinc-cadmium efflux system membrane fusion protein